MTPKALQILYGRLVFAALLCVAIAIVFEISRARSRQPVALAPLEPASMDDRASDALRKHVGDIDFSEVPMQQALRFLADRSGASLDCNVWGQAEVGGLYGIQEVAINTARPITLRLHNPTLGEALEAIRRVSNDEALEVEQDSAGVVLLVMEDRFDSNRSAPRFYNVADLVGTGANFVSRSSPSSDPYDPLHPLAAQADLDELSKALHPFAGPGAIGCFGHELIVVGPWRSRRDIEEVLQQMRAPIRLASAPTRALPVSAGEQGVQVTPRAYDVSQILANSAGWFVGQPAKLPWGLPVSKEGQLIELVAERARKMDPDFELRTTRPMIVLLTTEPMISCWKGILVLSVAPKVHDDIFSFLEHLQRTGRPQ